MRANIFTTGMLSLMAYHLCIAMMFAMTEQIRFILFIPAGIAVYGLADLLYHAEMMYRNKEKEAGR